MLIPQGCAINLIFYLHFDQIYSGPRPKFCPTSFCGHFRLFVFFYKNPFIWSKRKIIWVKLWLLKSFTFFASATFMDLKLKRLKETVLHAQRYCTKGENFPNLFVRKKNWKSNTGDFQFQGLRAKSCKISKFLRILFYTKCPKFWSQASLDRWSQEGLGSINCVT